MQTGNVELKIEDKVMDLASIRSGESVRLIGVNTGRSIQSRLLALGLIRGAEIRMISNEGNGPLLIGLGKSRMTIGRGMAEKIKVK